jgi:hypothetical protein
MAAVAALGGYVWLRLAALIADWKCDDSCVRERGAWYWKPEAWEWSAQFWLAGFGTALAVASLVLIGSRKYRLGIPLGVAAGAALVSWLVLLSPSFWI